MNCSTTNKLNSDNRPLQLSITPSVFLRVAPIIIWALAIMLPMFIGSRLYFAFLRQQQREIAAQNKQMLMTRSQQFMSRLNADQIARTFFAMTDYELLHSDYIKTGKAQPFLSSPLIKALPDFTHDLTSELLEFSRYIKDHYGFTPEFLFALNEDVKKCEVLFSERLSLAGHIREDLKEELAGMCRNLNRKMFYKDETPTELKHFIDFPVFNATLGIAHFFNTRFWRVDGRFSARLNRRIYLVTMRYPEARQKTAHLMLGFSLDNIPEQYVLKQTSKWLSDSNIKISPGHSSRNELPYFSESKNRLEMVCPLPVTFEHLYEAAENEKNRQVIRFVCHPTKALRELNRKIDNSNLILFVFGCISLLFAGGISMGRFELTTRLTRIIAGSFLACLLFPLTAIFWLGLLQSQTSTQAQLQQFTQNLSQRIAEFDTGLQMLSFERMLLIKRVANYLETLPMEKWERYVRYMFNPDRKRKFSQHFYNYFLYTSKDREYYRGQGPGERSVYREITRLFVGPSRKLMLQIGALAGMNSKEHERISQIADFASGLMDQLIRPNLLNELYFNQGQLMLSDFLARRSLFCSHFLRKNHKVIGYMIFMSDNLLLMDTLALNIAKGKLPLKFFLDGYQVETVLYPTGDYDERGLGGRIDYRGDRGVYEKDPYYEMAKALFAGSDFNLIDNLHRSDPHIIVTERIFNNTIFVFSIARPHDKNTSSMLPLFASISIACLSCFLLAAGMAKLLLRQIPPLLAAMREIENDSYDWQLSSNSGDEFAELATSINSMRVSLLERKKILQLVSADAQSAANDDLTRAQKANRRQAVILFCDIRNFTTISESCSAEEVVEMLNHYFSCLCPVIEENGGSVDKLVGDAIQAVFYGKKAVLAAAKSALAMRTRLAEFNQQRTVAGQFTVENGIGIASGMVVSGLVGSATGKLDATLLGAVLHRAQSLEAKSKYASNTKILLDHVAWQEIAELVETQILVFDNFSIDDGEVRELLKIVET